MSVIRFGAALLLLITLASCDGSIADRSAAPSESPRASSQGQTRPGIGLRSVLSLRTPYDLGPIAVQGEEVVAPVGDEGDWNRVAVIDPQARRLRIVAQSEFPQGFINWVAASGDWVSWVDQSHRQSDTNPSVLWRIHAIDLRTNQTRMLASNGQHPDPFVPEVRGGRDGLFWTQAEQDRTARERFWATGTKAPTDLMRHAEMTPGSETYAHEAVVFLGPSALPHKGHTIGGDCWKVSLSDHHVEPLTRTGLAMGCAASGDNVTWTQHADPQGRFVPAEGILDDPYEVLVRPLAGGSSRLLHRGYLAMGYPESGTTFTAWRTGRGLLTVRSLASPAQRLVPRSAGGLVFRAGDEALAFVRDEAGGDTVNVVQVRP